MSWLATNLIATCLLPPLDLLLLAIVGALLWRWRPAIGRTLVFAAFALLWLLATPYVSGALMRTLEGTPAALDVKAHPADAIVVLGGGIYPDAPEYGGDTVGTPTLVRLRYAAWLYRKTGTPILVTGGNPAGNSKPEAVLMKAVLEQEFRVPVKWVEDASNNTRENARFSRNILAPLGISRIYLVTHAWHMPRAARAFRALGFDVIPAPTGFTLPHATSMLDFLPDAGALRQSSRFMHEIIGLVWYRLHD